MTYIKPGAVRAAAKKGGRRVGKDFLQALDAHVDDIVGRAAATHNGGKKTLDREVLAYLTCKF